MRVREICGHVEQGLERAVQNRKSGPFLQGEAGNLRHTSKRQSRIQKTPEKPAEVAPSVGGRVRIQIQVVRLWISTSLNLPLEVINRKCLQDHTGSQGRGDRGDYQPGERSPTRSSSIFTYWGLSNLPHYSNNWKKMSFLPGVSKLFPQSSSLLYTPTAKAAVWPWFWEPHW